MQPKSGVVICLLLTLRAAIAGTTAMAMAPAGGSATPPRVPEPVKAATRTQRSSSPGRMWANGVPNYPDSDADGALALDNSKLGVDPPGPVMKAAQEIVTEAHGRG
jgi:hypothetical protein